MNIRRTHDKKLIRAIMTRPEIWGTVAEDGQESQNFDPETEFDCWLNISDDNLTVGLYNLHPENRSTLEAHIQMIPEYRKEYSLKAGMAFLRWFISECPDQYQKLIVKIPSLYPNVRSFVEGFGLGLEGTITKTHLKNGELHDIWILGITKDEVKEVLA